MEKLFTYGTIRNPRVQKRLLGETINGTPDSIKGYCKSKISIEGEQYPVLKPKPKSSVRGTVLEVSKKELKILDDYETDAYKRSEVRLASGHHAWTYKRRN